MASVAAMIVPAPRYGSPAEVAAVMGLSTKTVRRLIRFGVVPSYRIGRRVLVPFAAIDRFIQDRRTPLMAIAPTEATPLFDPETGQYRPLTDEERRALSEALRRALAVNATITDETDTDEVWDLVERLLAERP